MANTPFFARHGLNVNNFVQANSTTLSIGANVIANSTTLFIGNSTVNSIATSALQQISNSSGTANLTATSLKIGNTVANLSAVAVGNSTVNVMHTATSLTVGANVSLNSTALGVGNSTVNTNITAAGIKFSDGQTQNTAAFGKQAIWIPAGGMKPRANAGATANTYESVTNFQNFDVFDFDPVANNFVQFNIKMPKSWNGGNVTAQFVWLQPDTTTNFGVVWSIAGLSIANNEAIDTAMGTAVQVTSTGASNNFVYISPETANVTLANVSSQGLTNFEVKRVATDAADTMTVAAKLLGVTLYITSNSVNDA